MKKIAKAVSLLLVMIFAFSGMTVSVYAAGESSLTIKDYGDFAAVTSCAEYASGVIDIPSEKNGVPVTVIATGAFENCNKITQVNIPASITKVGNNAFDSCAELAKVVFAGADCKIDYAAFKACSKLTDITLPSGLKEIAEETFYDCASLVEIDIPETVEVIGKEAFRICKSLAQVNIPASVKVIGKNAFIGCTSVTAYNVAAENAVYSSADGIIYGPYQSPYDENYSSPVTDKTLIQYPAGKADTSCTVEADTLVIGDCAFGSSKNLTAVTLPEGLKRIDAYAFSESAITQVVIPSSVTKIGKLAFAKCASLKNITIPASVTDFDSAFYMSGLESVTLASGIRTVSPKAFEGCAALTSVSIPTSVEKIGMGAFYGCTALKNLEIPASVKTIENDAFGRCDNITLVVTPSSAAYKYAYDNDISFILKPAVEPTTKPTETTKPTTKPTQPSTKPTEPSTKPSQKEIASVVIYKLPVKTDYYYKDTIDTSGLELEVIYTDGSSEIIRSGFKVTPSVCTERGNQSVKVEYKGMTDSFDVSVSFAWWQWIIWILLLGFIWY